MGHYVELILLASVFAGCASEFDSTRLPGWSGTLGEEIFKIVCQRMGSEAARDAHEADPTQPFDVSGDSTRALCEGEVGPEAAPTPRLRALAENRARLVAALDATLPEEAEDDLEDFMLELLPFYDPPDELFPNATREGAALLVHLMEDREATEAFARIGGRDGYRPVRVALGVARPALAWDGLRDFLDVGLEALGDGGAANEAFLQMLDALALEMATTVPDGPGEITTRDIGRELMLTQHDDFGTGSPLHLPLRDRRGLPVPASLQPPFVDMDLDGLADADDKGRFVDASGAPLDVAAPYPVYGEEPFERDVEGRALKADLSGPLYQYTDVDRSLLAGLARELLATVDPSDPMLLDFVYGLRTMFGGDAPGLERLGDTTLRYTGVDTTNGPLFDVVHAVSILMARQEGDDVLEVLQVLMQPEYEPLLGALIESGFIAQANGDLDPEAEMIPEQELWDGILELATIVAEDGYMEPTLRTFVAPEARHIGQILAELMRHKDTPEVDFEALRTMPRLSGDLFDAEVVREDAHGNPVREWLPGSTPAPYPSSAPDNMSLFGQTLAAVHELDGVPFCNKEGATFHDLFGGGTDLDNFLNGFVDRLFPGGFAECSLLALGDLAEAYARAITGRISLELQPGTGIADLINWLRGPPLELQGTIDTIFGWMLSRGMGVPGLTVTPDPIKLNRLVFGEPTPFTSALIDPALTRYGDVIVERYPPTVLAWERTYCFDGDLLVETVPCEAPLEEAGFFESMTPIVNVFLDHKEEFPDRPFLFTLLANNVWRYWTSAADTMFQADDPDGPRYVVRGNGVSYEALTADLLADCGWDRVGPGRVCDPELSAHMWTRTVDLLHELDAIEIRPGVDGITVMARALEVMLDPAESPGLTNRAGEDTTFTNGGTRELPQTPMYLLLDALNDMDAAFAAAEPERHRRWLSARSRIADQFLMTVPDPEGTGGYVLQNRRVHAALEVLLPFLKARIAEHEALGDRRQWALGLADRFEASMGSAISSGIIRVVDALQSDPAAREQLGLLAVYLTNELSDNGAFDATVLAIADLMQWMEDDANIPPILNALAEGAAHHAREAAAGDAAPDAQGAMMNRAVRFLREVNAADSERALAGLLERAVTPPAGSDETPLEVLLDVIAEVNRADPGRGDSLGADDYEAIFDSSAEFLVDEYRGLERLYDVVQQRELE